MGVGSYTNAALSQPVMALGISGLSLLLLVIVLLSVPGPVESLYWFEMDSPTGEGAVLKTGVNGWCWAGVSCGQGFQTSERELKIDCSTDQQLYLCRFEVSSSSVRNTPIVDR
jgi:hypothetical protein